MGQRIGRAAALAAAAMVAAVGVLTPVSPASAAKAAVSMTFDAAPEPVSEGRTITLAGRAWRGATGNTARVEFWFRKAGRTTYAYVTSTTSGASGAYRKTVRAGTTGVWKAVYKGNAKRAAATRFDAVQVLGYRNRATTVTLFSRTGSAGLQDPVRTIGAGPVTVTYSRTCTEPAPLMFSWNGSPTADHASFSVDPGDLSGTRTLHPDVTSGYFRVSASSGCSWSITATQSATVRTRVQV